MENPSRRETGRKGGKKGRRWGKKRPAEGMEEADSPFTSYGKMKRRSKLEMNDDDLFFYFDNRLAGQTDCKNKECNCLILLGDELPRKAVARYLVWFERKTKYDQDGIILEWFRYANAAVRSGTSRARQKGRTNYYHLPFDGNFVDDEVVLKSLRDHRLCTSGMRLVMSIGYERLRSIQTAARSTGVMPRHGLAGTKSNSTKVTASVLEDLQRHFNYLLQLGEVRATRVMATLVDGVAGRTNREEAEEMVYLPISMGY